MANREDISKIRNLFLILIVIILSCSVIGLSAKTVDSIINLFVKYVIIPAFTSLIVGSLVDSLTGQSLKNYFLIIKIGHIKLSVTVYALTVVIVKFLIFR
jgi:uncharacterized membrane protein